MGQFGAECCAFLFALGAFSAFVTTQSYHGDARISNKPPSRDHSWYVSANPSSMIDFNRRKRSIAFGDSYRPTHFDQQQLDSFLDEGFPERSWSVASSNEGKRHTVNFTPRLGRESEETSESVGSNWFGTDSDTGHDYINRRSPPFAPRLGRRTNTYYFDPRLGKRAHQ